MLDCSSIADVDYSASLTLAGLIDSVHENDGVFALAEADPELMATLHDVRNDGRFDNAHIYATIADAVSAFQASSQTDTDGGAPPVTL